MFWYVNIYVRVEPQKGFDTVILVKVLRKKSVVGATRLLASWSN